MNDLRLTNQEIQLLQDLISYDSISIIWDINAFYFNTDNITYKLECHDEHPEGTNNKYKELFCVRFQKLKSQMHFLDDSATYWHKTMAVDTQIEALTVIETGVLFCQNEMLEQNASVIPVPGLNLVSLGLLISTSQGILPALLRPFNFGFDWLDEYKFYTTTEVEELLERELAPYHSRVIH